MRDRMNIEREEKGGEHRDGERREREKRHVVWWGAKR